MRQQSEAEIRLGVLIAKRREVVEAAKREDRTLTRAEATAFVRMGREVQGIIEVLSLPVTRVPPVSPETQRQAVDALHDAGWK